MKGDESKLLWLKIANGEEIHEGIMRGVIDIADLTNESYEKIAEWNNDRVDEVEEQKSIDIDELNDAEARIDELEYEVRKLDEGHVDQLRTINDLEDTIVRLNERIDDLLVKELARWEANYIMGETDE